MKNILPVIYEVFRQTVKVAIEMWLAKTGGSIGQSIEKNRGGEGEALSGIRIKVRIGKGEKPFCIQR